LRILAYCDNPLEFTGFSNVARPILEAFVKAGHEVAVVGIGSSKSEGADKLPYTLWPVFGAEYDPERKGFDRFQYLIHSFRPDVVWIVIDPGSLHQYLYWDQGFLGMLQGIRGGEYQQTNLGEYKIVAYCPIEGDFLDPYQILSLKKVEENGAIVFYTPGSVRVVRKFWAEAPDRWVYHGLDHADFRQYTPEERSLIRKFIHIDDRFIVGTVGVNKRTKGLAETLDVAVELKKMGRMDILFYLHTVYDEPVMQGQFLFQLAQHKGVDDMVVFKPRKMGKEQASIHQGGTLNVLKKLTWPPPADFFKEATFVNGVDVSLLSDYDFNSRLNMLDLYFDPSSVEGWSLPVGEAMRCGVPVLGVRDEHVRDEIYGEYRTTLESLPRRIWDHWHTGAKLVRFDPLEAAKKIIWCKDNLDELRERAKIAKAYADTFKWEDSARSMLEIVEEVVRPKEENSSG
jgi:glycosyltransferase involved in cell wall biosynthesis